MGFKRRFLAFTAFMIRWVTKVLLAVGLFLVYFLALGFTRLSMELFERRKLRPPRVAGWQAVPVEGARLEDALRQS